jgi:hypothetical protein
MTSCSKPGSPPPEADPAAAAFAAEWKAWHEQRIARLAAPDGWTALVGLHWLEPGENRIPGLPGVFVLADGAVTLRASAADGWRLEGGEAAPVEARALATDAAEKPDRLEQGSRKAVVIDRGGKLAVRVWDAESPARKGFRGVDAWPADPRWKVTARWEPYEPPREVDVPSVTGTPTREKVPGRAVFEVAGKSVALEPTGDGGDLFFVFKDATAPRETYGGGRFLSAAAPKDGTVVLDFNRAYNPPCVFTPFATCPLPRPENVLAVRIEAGEKVWGAGR